MLEAAQDLSPIPELGQSFGLGFALRADAGRTPVSGSVGDYFWAGAAGTYFWIDPQEKLYAVMMLQMPFMPAGHYRRAMRELAHRALIR